MVTGCGGRASNQPNLVPVSGAITLDGKPLSGVALVFTPTGSTRGTGATGYTDTAGKYELTATHGGKGTPVGKYQVVATKLVMPDGSDFPVGFSVAPITLGARDILPPKYSAPDRTVLTATVHDGTNTIDFPLSSKP